MRQLMKLLDAEWTIPGTPWFPFNISTTVVPPANRACFIVAKYHVTEFLSFTNTVLF